MFMRLLQLKINPSNLGMFQPFYDKIVIPELQKMSGCQFAGLIQSSPHPDEVISITFWDTQSHAEAYEKSGVYQKLLQQVRPFLSESTEWKIQLSENLELEYKPVPEEPILKEYVVATQTDIRYPMPQQNPRIYVRIVSAKIQEGKLEEFKQLYSEEIIPALRATKGCRYAYLTESLQEKNEFISVTIWDSKKDAEDYEVSGRFTELVNKVKHTFSYLYQWKMALEKDLSGHIITSDDLSVTYYSMVTGKSFD